MRSAGIVGLTALLISSPVAGLAQQVEITIEQIETVVFPAEGGAAAQAIVLVWPAVCSTVTWWAATWPGSRGHCVTPVIPNWPRTT